MDRGGSSLDAALHTPHQADPADGLSHLGLRPIPSRDGDPTPMPVSPPDATRGARVAGGPAETATGRRPCRWP